MPVSPVLVVVKLSDSFSDFWPALAEELGAAFAEWSPSGGESCPANVAAIILAAGGREAVATETLATMARRPDVPTLVVGATLSHRLAARAVALGASDCFVLPEDRDGLRDVLRAALERRRAALRRATLATLETQAHAFRDIVGASPALRSALERAARVLPHADATVLIAGASGTGKELLARALHYGGPRAAAPFVDVNCAALPPQLLESELFGHERGAFTDAKTAKPGLFEVAAGGTLFLDEIDHLPLELQTKLLRALELKVARRLGSTTNYAFNVRIVAATNTDLGAAVRDRLFREDLYYRLQVVTLELPPLKERGDDVLLLAEHFLQTLCAQYGLPRPNLTAEVQEALRRAPWPGNVRELRNSIERALLLSAPGALSVDELQPVAPSTTAAGGEALPFPARLAEIQRAAAQAMVRASAGNRSEAARRLGISRSRLQRLLSGHDEAGAAGEADDPP
jgi:two-component system response regulator HydG